MKYYVYQHIRDDKNTVFYIGIGTKSKQDLKYRSYKRAKEVHKDNSIWLRIVKKTSWRFEIISEHENRLDAEKEEIRLITHHGRLSTKEGLLANLTLGGESNKGYVFTDEQRKKISDSQKGKPGRRLGAKLTDEQKARFSVIQKKVASRPDRIEYRRKLALGNSYHLGMKHSDEAKKKMSDAAKKRKTNSRTIPCKLIDKQTGEVWEAESFSKLSKISPLSVSTITKLFGELRPLYKIKERYEYYKI
jgi:hypothetical protein